MVAKAFDFLKGNGTPALVKSDIPGVEIEYIDGVNLTKTSVASSMFVDLLPSKELINPQVVTLFQPIDRFEEIFQFVKKLNQYNGYTILLYNEISNSALENLLFNLSQNRSRIVPISIKNYGKNMNDMFDEISKYVNSNIIDGGSLKATDISKIQVGKVDKAIVSQESLVLVNNEDSDNNDYTFISKKACIIRVGGASKIDMEDNYRRIEDAIYSVSGAIKCGAFFGGYGYPYKELSDKIDDVGTPAFIIDALCYINHNIFNDSVDKDNAIDSALVVSQVIKNSFIMAAQVITTKAIVYDSIR